VADTQVDVPKRATSAVKKLSMPGRVTAFALGLAGLGAGAVAVFVTHLEAGPVALLAVGLIFMIVGLAGTLPNRLRVGDNEAAWEVERQAVGTFVERVAEDIPVANQRDFLGALGDLAEDAPEVAARGISAVGYETTMLREIESVVSEMNASYRGAGPLGYSMQLTGGRDLVDAIVQGPTGHRVAIEARISTKTVAPVWIDLLHQRLFGEPRTSEPVDGLLLITRTPLTPRIEESIQRYLEIRHVLFRGPEDREALKLALRAFLVARKGEV
jgi:hypothetical protein